ncbi:Multidrug resistance-associated protein 1, partial [Kappamyces sp. JEL0680]
MRGFSLSASTFISVVSFAVYQYLGNAMTPAIVFPALLYFDMSEPFKMISYTTNVTLQAIQGIKHVSEFFECEEFEEEQGTVDYATAASAVSLTRPVWKYEDELPSDHSTAAAPQTGFELVGISMEIPKGAFVGICGSVGCGKTTLLTSLLGQASLNGKIAYCSQEPWILKGNIRDNILFGSPLNEFRMSQVIGWCGLSTDIGRLSDGILTEIGEGGVNLSGGQKSRVALARALYSDADIFLLDDPLSSCDSRIGRSIFQELKRVLAGKTVLLVTHSFEQLSHTDCIISLETGKISEFDTYDNLAAKSHGTFSALRSVFQSTDATPMEEAEPESLSPSSTVSSGSKAKEFVTKEHREKGAVRWELYQTALVPIRPLLMPLLALFLWTLISSIASPLWLVHWTNSNSHDHFYVYVYSALGLSAAFSSGKACVVYAVVVMFACFAIGGVKISQYFHDGALKGLLKAKMSYFDTNPVGRLINLMSADVRALDSSAAYNCSDVTLALVSCISVLVIVCQTSPVLIFLFIFIFAAAWRLFSFYRPPFIELKRLRSNIQSPLDAHVNETLNGICTIKAYRKQAEFVNELQARVNRVEATTFTYYAVILWFEERLQLMTALIFLSIAFLASSSTTSASYGSIIGLALSYSSSLTSAIEQLLLAIGSAEASMNAIERLNRVREHLPSEGPARLETDPSPEAWPSRGEIAIKDLVLAYDQRPDSPIINNVSFSVMAGEKIGICGRSGCGKSTLVSGLFRLLERQQGSIVIDGIDVASLGLATLRSRMQIIPQDPVLFEGSIRSNLGLEYPDSELWSALDHAGLKDFVSELDAKLDAAVATNGTNFSFGQRQLLCLARAMLAKPK